MIFKIVNIDLKNAIATANHDISYLLLSGLLHDTYFERFDLFPGPIRAYFWSKMWVKMAILQNICPKQLLNVNGPIIARLRD